MLKIDNLHVSYGAILAIKGISMEVNKGEIVTLIGANGAGKSTIINTISQIVKNHSGTITFEGEEISKSDAKKGTNPGPGPYSLKRS